MSVMTRQLSSIKLWTLKSLSHPITNLYNIYKIDKMFINMGPTFLRMNPSRHLGISWQQHVKFPTVVSSSNKLGRCEIGNWSSLWHFLHLARILFNTFGITSERRLFLGLIIRNMHHRVINTLCWCLRRCAVGCVEGRHFDRQHFNVHAFVFTWHQRASVQNKS